MRSSRPKPLHLICGRAMVMHVIHALETLAPDRTVVVVGHGADASGRGLVVSSSRAILYASGGSDFTEIVIDSVGITRASVASPGRSRSIAAALVATTTVLVTGCGASDGAGGASDSTGRVPVAATGDGRVAIRLGDLLLTGAAHALKRDLFDPPSGRTLRTLYQSFLC